MTEELNNNIQISEYSESADEYCEFLFDEINSTDGFKTLTEVKDWVEDVEKADSGDEPKEDRSIFDIKKIYWISSENGQLPLGIGFVNFPMKDLREGIYFRDPDWYEGKVCRVNNNYDIALFILAARELKDLNEKGKASLSTLE